MTQLNKRDIDSAEQAEHLRVIHAEATGYIHRTALRKALAVALQRARRAQLAKRKAREEMAETMEQRRTAADEQRQLREAAANTIARSFHDARAVFIVPPVAVAVWEAHAPPPPLGPTAAPLPPLPSPVRLGQLCDEITQANAYVDTIAIRVANIEERVAMIGVITHFAFVASAASAGMLIGFMLQRGARA